MRGERKEREEREERGGGEGSRGRLASPVLTVVSVTHSSLSLIVWPEEERTDAGSQTTSEYPPKQSDQFASRILFLVFI